MLFFLLTWTTNAQDIPQNAWLCEYFDVRGNVISTRIEDKIKHDFNTVVKEGVQKEGLGARWVGDFQFDSVYVLKVTSDKSIRMLVDDVEVISDLYNSTKNVYVDTIQPSSNFQRLTVEYNLNNRVVIADDSTWVDDSEQDKIIYYNNWRISDTLAVPIEGVPGSCYCSWYQNANDSLVLRFTNATEFHWIGEMMTHHGIAEVFLNDVYQGEKDTYSAANEILTTNWSFTDLDPEKVYKFKLVGTGRKNPASTWYGTVIHGFKLMNKSEPPIDLNNPVTVENITISASSYQNDPDQFHPPKNLMDKDLGTKWSAKGIEEWVLFDLGKEQAIQSVAIAFTVGTRNDIFTLKVGSHPDTLITILDNQEGNLGTELDTYDFPDIQGRYVKYISLGNKQNPSYTWTSVSEFIIDHTDIIVYPPKPPDHVQVDIVRQGYFIVLKDGVQFEGGHSEYDKAVEKAVNLLLKNPTSNILIQAPSWRVEY